MGPAITQAIAGWIINFAKLIPQAWLGAASLFCIRNKPMETKAHGVAAAAKKEITCARGSYICKSLADQSKPATGATNRGFVHSDFITLKIISWDFLWDSIPISINTVAKANIPKTIKVEMMAGAMPSCPSARAHRGMPMYPVFEYDALKPLKLAAAKSQFRNQLSKSTNINTIKQLNKKAVINAGCQSVFQPLLAAKLKSCAGKANQTTKRLSSVEALAPNLPERPQTYPMRISANTGKTTLNT